MERFWRRGDSDIDLSQFRLQQAVFEARYEGGWRLWDRAGAIWTTMNLKRPNLRSVSAQPNITVFRLGSKYELSVELDKAVLKAHNPERSLAEFQAIAAQLLEVSSSELEIGEFTRLGLRLIFLREYASAHEASDEMLKLQLMRIPEGSRFGVKDGRPNLPEYAIRWENEDLAAHMRIKAEPRTFRIELPFAWEGAGSQPEEQEKVGFSLDLDYYTKSLVNVNQLKTDEWIGTGYRHIRRDLEAILQGQ